MPDSDRLDDAQDETPDRRIAGMSVRHLVMGTLIALIVAVAAGALVALSMDDDGDPEATDAVIELGPDDGTAPGAGGDVIGRPVAAPFTTFDGVERNTAAYLGRPLVLNLFAEWCAPCRAELPAFEAVFQENAGEVAFLGISSEESAEDGQLLVDDTGITFDVGRDPEGDMFVLFGGTGMPTTAFIDAQGTVREVHSGALTAEELRERIAEHFG